MICLQDYDNYIHVTSKWLILESDSCTKIQFRKTVSFQFKSVMISFSIQFKLYFEFETTRKLWRNRQEIPIFDFLAVRFWGKWSQIDVKGLHLMTCLRGFLIGPETWLL